MNRRRKNKKNLHLHELEDLVVCLDFLEACQLECVVSQEVCQVEREIFQVVHQLVWEVGLVAFLAHLAVLT
jgi:hypothetical protein